MGRLLLVDKPVGPTSHDVVAGLRRALGEKRAGHCGTLDPAASGLLLVLTGEATRLAEVFVGHGKLYRGCVRFGSATDTDDAQGQAIASLDAFAIAPAALAAALAELAARRSQRPPGFSAIKQGGVPLYKLARSGRLDAASLPERPVRIERLEQLAFDGRDLDLEIACSTGTYVRALARDLGELLGVPAHLAALRRLASGPFRIEQAAEPRGPDAGRRARGARPAARRGAGLPAGRRGHRGLCPSPALRRPARARRPLLGGAPAGARRLAARALSGG